VIARLLRRLVDWLAPRSVDASLDRYRLAHRLTTAKTYDERQAFAKAKAARKLSPTGRKYQGPKKATPKKDPAPVVQIQDARRAR